MRANAWKGWPGERARHCGGLYDSGGRLMDQKDALVLEDGAIYYGTGFGAPVETEGEVVFFTGMTGYQEVCTDPSYHGQMVVFTYPLIGNYGINDADAESRRPWAAAIVVREYVAEYSNWRATGELSDYLGGY